MPWGARRLADVAGVEVALAIVLKRGGTRLLIPQRRPA